MRIKFTEAHATKAGTEADVLPAAGRRLVAKGFAEEVKGGSTKATDDADDKPAAKTTKKAAAKKS